MRYSFIQNTVMDLTPFLSVSRVVFAISFLLTFSPSSIIAQMNISQAMTPTQYVNNVLLGEGVTATNVTFSGSLEQIGYMTNGGTFGIESGVVLSTDHATHLSDPGCSNSQECIGCLGGGADADLLNVANSVPPLIGQSFSVSSVNDLCILEFDFEADGDSISLNYVFGSDEYLAWVNSVYNDVFAFFLSGPGITGPFASPAGFPDGAVNIALIPDTVPFLPITSSSINDILNQEYYINNPNAVDAPCINGYTVPFTASHPVSSGLTYHVKLAIADGSDTALESIVVLEEGSFGSNGYDSDFGCTTPFACNYDSEATIDDGSCLFICEGCTDSVACNYDTSANVDDSSCEYLSCAGCTDAISCNYNSSSTIDNGSCIYPEQYYDCLYNCLNDSDSDGICDEYEIQGCTDSVGCNYDSQATDDDGSCEYITCAGCQYEFACNYDPDATIADNESCEFGTCPGCTDPTACNFNPTVYEDDGSCFYPGAPCDDENANTYGDILQPSCECIGYSCYPGAPCDDENAYTYGDILQPSCECIGYSCSYSEACNYTPIFEMGYNGDGLFLPDDQSQCFTSQLNITNHPGIVITNANNDIESFYVNMEHSYMGDLTITFICPSGQSILVHQQSGGGTFLGVPVDNDGLPNDLGIGWDYWWEPGATNGTWAEEAPGTYISLTSGYYSSVQPFTNLNGCPLNGTWEVEVCDLWGSDNGFIFDWGITFDGFGDSLYINNNYCLYTGSPCYDGNELTVNDAYTDDCECLGDCQYDMDNDGICDLSCSNDLNNDGVTTVQDLLLVLSEFGCYENCDNDPNGDGVVNVQDLLSILTVFGTLCEPTGCTDSVACNYDSQATGDDGSCEYETCAGCQYETACNYDPEATIADNESCEYGTCPGCTDPTACNFNPTVYEDDGSCVYAETYYNCGGTCLSDTDQDGVCDELEVGGCTDPEADNYNSDATDEDGSCEISGFQNCGDLVSHEGYDYSTVQIGDQCWFSENCRYLPDVFPSNEESSNEPHYYVYGYEGTDVTEAKATANYDTYGVIYNWPAVMTEGICPSGWHIPTDEEWQTMEISLGMSEAEANDTGYRGTDEGYQMKSTSGWMSGGNGSNSSGWTGLTGGFRYSSGFVNGGASGGWWSASESGSGSWIRRLDYYSDGVYRNVKSRGDGFSARCVRD